jgi:hypothetical protein
MRRFWTLFAIGLCVAIAGCGSKHDDRPAAHPVAGKIFVNGTPAANARVALYPTDKPGAHLRPHAVVEPDGSFHLTTFKTRDGAPAGEYALTVTWPGPLAKGQGEDEEGPDRLERRYADPKHPATRVCIVPETAELETIDLKPVEAKARETSRRNPSIEE